MRTSLLFLGLGAFTLSSVAATSVHSDVKSGSMPERAAETFRAAKQLNKRNAAAKEIWRAARIENYGWNSESNDWQENEIFAYTYNLDGSIKTKSLVGDNGMGEEMVWSRTEYTYDENGFVIKEEEYHVNGDEMVLGQTTDYEYDPIVKDLIVRITLASEFGNRYEYIGVDITRNADGNITRVREYFSYDDNGTPVKSYSSSYMVVDYGADGKAISIRMISAEDGVEVVEEEITDLIWENTDGQIYMFEVGDPDSSSYFGANRVKSATIKDDEWPLPANLTVEYTENGYHSLLKMTNDERLAEIEYTSVDEYGSYDLDHYEVDYDDEDGDNYIDYSRDLKATKRFDRFGLLLEYIYDTVYHYGGGDERKVEVIKGDVTYDPVYGYPTEYIRKFKQSDMDEYENGTRAVYSDYTDYYPLEVEKVEMANDEAEVYYNLQGIKVIEPRGGIFIRRHGKDVKKVFIR